MSGLTQATCRTNLVVMENNIQQARDVLAKWREGADAYQPWLYEESSRKGYYGASVYSSDEAEYSVTSDATDGNARLIAGTAGNPDLLDAIDDWLRVSPAFERLAPIAYKKAQSIAAAIVAAGDRMNA